MGNERSTVLLPEHIVEIVGAEPVVHRYLYRTDLRKAIHHEQSLATIVQPQRNMIAVVDTSGY